jgi:hypothetical protein
MLRHKEGRQLFAGEKLSGVCDWKRATDKRCVCDRTSFVRRTKFWQFFYTVSCLGKCTMDPALLLVSFAKEVIFGPGKHD